ncbi:carboxymuconolactone decarboxylase [Streptomyces sp. NBC_01235]|uniref:carboxymuconolactone decarboxylase n=1 Tax=Streptomyces sp. NBC_01235 TaxID=2903788 RepID=UPI002E1613A3|nr:carboxymuconolactone decarboxylase [Streptomyces sp. NBC_01235]
MATASETPVLDTLAAMTVDSIERCGLAPDMFMLTRIAALAASDAPPISYAANIGPAGQAGLSAEQLQDVLVAIAPIVGTARVMTAAGNIAEALGVAIAVADSQGRGRA